MAVALRVLATFSWGMALALALPGLGMLAFSSDMALAVAMGVLAAVFSWGIALAVDLGGWEAFSSGIAFSWGMALVVGLPGLGVLTSFSSDMALEVALGVLAAFSSIISLHGGHCIKCCQGVYCVLLRRGMVMFPSMSVIYTRAPT